MSSNKKIDLVILAGGKGSRISKYLKRIPKPLFQIDNIPFIQHLVNYFHKYPFENTYILAGYRGRKIYKLFNGKIFNLIRINCLIENSPRGTGGSLNLLRNSINNNFVLINGDSILLHDYKFIFKNNFDLNKNYIFLTKNTNYKSNNKLSNISLNKKNQCKFDKSRAQLMNAGVYLLKKSLIKNKYIKKVCSLEEDIIPKLINQKKLFGIYSKSPFIDIGTPVNLRKAKPFLRKYLSKSCAFFDRDGVINVDKGYVHKIKDLKFMKGVKKAIKYLIKKNFYIFIVTNQSGIGKKIFSEKQFLKFQNYMKWVLIKNDIHIDDVQFSPYHNKALILKYKKRTNFRKPGDGMIKEIKKKFLLKNKKSFLIGDKKTDFLSAKKSKLYFEYSSYNLYNQVKKIVN